MSHVCLRPEEVLALLRSERHYPESFPAIAHRLSTCPTCWQAIDTLREQPFEEPKELLSPFKAFFVTLIIQDAGMASHRRALAAVRESEIALYRLLLEEVSAYLPYADYESSQYTLLFFDLLLDRLPTSPQRRDLEAGLSVLTALFWAYYGANGRQVKHLELAKQHREQGTGDPELHATILGVEAELTCAPDVAIRNMTRAIDLVADFPERRVEMLFTFGKKLILLGEPIDAWERLIEAEDLAERYSPHLLSAIRGELLPLESNRGQTATTLAERLLYRCLAHHHVRSLQGEILDLPTPPPACGSAAAEFANLCLAMAGGHDMSDAGLARAGQAVRASATGLQFLEEFFCRLTFLQERFPDGQLSRELLVPLLTHLQQLEAA